MRLPQPARWRRASQQHQRRKKKKVVADVEPVLETKAVHEVAAEDPGILELAQSKKPVENGSPLDLWRSATANCEGMLSECAAMAIEVKADDKTKVWEIVLPAGSEFALQIFNEPKNLRLLKNALVQQQGTRRELKFRTAPASAAAAGLSTETQARPTRMNQNQLMRHANTNSFILSLTEKLDAEVIRVDVPPDWTPE